MKRVAVATILALMPGAALAQQTDPAQSAVVLSLNLQREAVQAQDMAAALAALKTQLDKETAEAAYWRDACQSTPECSSKPK